MSRRPFGWNLPPGVTDRQIDETVQADEPPDEPFELLADLTERLHNGERLLVEAVRQLSDAKGELARRNAQCAALLDVAEAAKDLLAAEYASQAADPEWTAERERLRRALAACADVPKAEPPCET